MEHSEKQSPAEVLRDIAACSHNVLYEQVSLTRRASLSLDDQQYAAEARQLLGRQAEEVGDVRLYQQLYVQASEQKGAFSDHRQARFIPAYTRLLVSGIGFKDTEVVARTQLAKLCSNEHAPLAMRVLMQECFTRGEPPEKWLKAFAPSPDLYAQGALAYHALVPEEKRIRDPSTDIIKRLAVNIVDHQPDDLICLGNSPAAHLVAPLLKVVAQPYAESSGLALALAKIFYDNDNLDYDTVARVGLVVLDSPLLMAHMGEQAIRAEDVQRQACAALNTVQRQLREIFWYAARQFTMDVATFRDYVNKSHSQPDNAFNNAMQRYLKHGMIGEAAFCLRHIHAPFLWASAVLDYTGFSTSGVALSEEEKWMAQLADGKSQVRPFVEYLVELNHAAAATELMKLLSRPTQDPQFAPFFMKAVAKLVQRDRPVGERFCLDVLHQAMNNQQYTLVHTLADIGMEHGFVSVAQRYARDFLYTQYHRYHGGRIQAAIITARHSRRLKKTLKT